MEFSEFFKSCEKRASQQTTRMDQLVAEAIDVIMDDHHSDAPTDWDTAMKDLESAIRQNSDDKLGRIAQIFALIGMMEVSRRMLED